MQTPARVCEFCRYVNSDMTWHTDVNLIRRISSQIINTDVIMFLTNEIIQGEWLRGADKSLARPGMKQARKHVRDARDFNNIETRAVIEIFFSWKARRRRKFTPF